MTSTFLPLPLSAHKPIALYDGQCPFCTKSALQLQSLVRGRIQAVDLHTPGVLERFSISRDAALEALHLRLPDGRVYRGAEAVARSISLVPVLGLLGWVYYVPGLRQLLDRGYRRVAAARYRIWGRRNPDTCESGACELHFGPKKR